MKKIHILIFIFFILFTLTCNSSAIDITIFDQTDINPSVSNIISHQLISNPFIIALPLIYLGIILIFIHLFQNTKNDKLVVKYKILILVFTLLLHISFKESNGRLYYYSTSLFFALIQIFLGIFPEKNNLRIILTLIPCIILCVLFLPTITSTQCGIIGDPNHKMFHIMENITYFFVLVIIPEIISQLALTPLYLYYKKNNN